MKKFQLLLLLFLLMFTNSCFAIAYSVADEVKVKKSILVGDDAIQYNDKIVGLQMVILKDMMKTMKLEGEDIIKDLKGTIKITKQSIKSLKKLKVYIGGDAMKAKALDLFNFYLKTMEGPWMEAFKIYVEKGQDMNEEELTRFKNLLTAPGVEEVKYDEAFSKAQESFAKANGFTIQKNEMQDEIDGI